MLSRIVRHRRKTLIIIQKSHRYSITLKRRLIRHRTIWRLLLLLRLIRSIVNWMKCG